MNLVAVKAIYRFEMARMFRTPVDSLLSPVLSTALYFIVFGAAIGDRIDTVDGIDYGAFIVPGLTMMLVLTQSVANASFGIYFPRFTGSIYEVLAAPISAFEAVLGFVGAAATKSLILGALTLATARFFVPYTVAAPLAMAAFLLLTALAFSLLGFIIGIWADSFERLQLVPLLIISPLSFLGGAFYSIDMLPEPWRTISLANPVVYLVSGFRWSFFGSGDVPVAASLGITCGFVVLCLAAIVVIFRTGWRLKP